MKKEGGEKKVGSVFAFLITITIIFILFLAGPAQAFILGFAVLDNDVNKGESLDFTASVEIEEDEFLDIEKFILELNGPKKIKCEFFPNGSIIEGCDGIGIEQIEITNFSFGYGFEEGFLRYNISINTENHKSGIYDSLFSILIDSEKFDIFGDRIIIRNGVDKPKECSIRAENGMIDVNGQTFKNINKLNFNVPKENARNGKGFLTGQDRRNRLSYDFNVVDVLENSDDNYVAIVDGSYRINRGNLIEEEATIFFYKNTNTIKIFGMDINAEGMVVNFVKGCGVN